MKTNYLTKAIATIGLAGSLLCAQSTKADVVEELMGKSILAQDYNEDNSCLFNEEPLAEYFTGVSSRKYEMPKIMKAKISDGELGYDDANELVEYYNNEEAKELAMIQSERDQISLAGQNLENQKGANESQLGELNSQLEEISEKSYVPVTGFVKKKLEELEKKVMFYYPNLTGTGREKVVYDADSEITPEVLKTEGEIIHETREFLRVNDMEDELGPIYNNVRGLLTFYNFLSNLNPKISQSKTEKDFIQDKKGIISKKADLEKSVEEMNGQIKILEYFQEEYLEKYISLNSPCKEEIKSYAEIKELEKNFVVEKDFRKFWGVSIATYLRITNNMEDLKKQKNDFLNPQEIAISDLKFCLVKKYNLDSLNLEKIKSPRQTKVSGWASFLFGFFFPVARNLALTYYLTGGKAKESRVGGSFLAGVGNFALGWGLLDGLHPAIYPIRLFLTPVIIQPILKWTGFYTDNGGDNPIIEFM